MPILDPLLRYGSVNYLERADYFLTIIPISSYLETLIVTATDIPLHPRPRSFLNGLKTA